MRFIFLRIDAFVVIFQFYPIVLELKFRIKYFLILGKAEEFVKCNRIRSKKG